MGRRSVGQRVGPFHGKQARGIQPTGYQDVKQSLPRYPTVAPSDADWIRLAAFIDGEGSILINKLGTKKRHRLLGKWMLRVVICNTDPRLPRWCQDTFGGGFTIGYRPKKPNHRMQYKWLVSTKQAQWILEGCMPHFLIKREQAEIALAFRSTFSGKQGGRKLGLTEAEGKFRENCREQLRLERCKEYPRMRCDTPDNQVIQ